MSASAQGIAAVAPVNRKTVAVFFPPSQDVSQGLLDVLSELYPVDFRRIDARSYEAADAVILSSPCEGVVDWATSMFPVCLIMGAGTGSRNAITEGAVEFTDSPSLDSCFRGQTMTDEGIEDFSSLEPQLGDETICSVDGWPYWLVRRSSRATVWLAALKPPDFGRQDTVYSIFNRRRWLQVLPIMHFLKCLTQDVDWMAPPLRACFIIDDPNLHWSSYGYIDFRKLVRHAQDHKYHVALATVPIDAWLALPSVAALVRVNSTRLSLVIHGNDHLPNEFGMVRTEEQAATMLAQALRRIERFELRTGVRVSRVMTPPHGAIRHNVFSALCRLGYEACSVSRSSLLGWNRDRVWPRTFGFQIAEIVEDGLPVISRHVMARGHEGAYRLAAFLHQPIVPHGHHEDCRGGLELLAEVARSVNDIGDVRWMDMRSITRSNYLTRLNDGLLLVRMLAGRVELPVQEAVSEIVVERPWLAGEGDEQVLICRSEGATLFAESCGVLSRPIRWSGGGTAELLSPPRCALHHGQVRSPQRQIWALARRILCEGRDRIGPLFAC